MLICSLAHYLTCDENIRALEKELLEEKEKDEEFKARVMDLRKNKAKLVIRKKP